MAELPPLPPGFTLDEPDLPPLPPGFTLDSAQAEPVASSAGPAMSPLVEHGRRNLQTGGGFSDADGMHTILSGSVNDERLNQGRPTVIPFVYEGRKVDLNEAIERAVQSGVQWPSANTHEEATRISKEASRAMDQFAPRTPEYPQETIGQWAKDYLGRELSPAAIGSAVVRPAVKAATAIPGMFADAAAGAVNLMGGNMQLPTQAVEQQLDRFTQRPAGVGKVAEGISTALLSSRVPVPKIGQQAPSGFTQKPDMSVAEETFAQARKAGYVIPPSTLKPTAGRVAAESVGGKAAVQQLASRRNQEVTNKLVAKGLGLPDRIQVTPKVLEALRRKAGGAYEAVGKSGNITADSQYLDDLAVIGRQSDEIAAAFPEANVGKSAEVDQLVNSLLRDRFDAKPALSYLKELRKNASANLSGVNAADPAKVSLGRAQRDAAAALEDLIVRHLKSQGKGGLAKAFDEARILIAKTHSAEKALNPGTGNFNARALATELKRGKPLSGEFETIAKFASAFPKAADEVLTSPGVSALDAALTAGGGVALGAMNPSTAPLALAWPAARYGARRALLSDSTQNALLNTPASGNALRRAPYLTGAVPIAQETY